MKTCSKCKVEKELDQFNIRIKNTDGYQGQCKPCSKERVRQTKAKKVEQYKARRKAYKEANKEKISLQNKEYGQKNKEKISDRKRKFRQENREKLSAQKKEYRSRPEIKERDKLYNQNKYKTDIIFKLKNRLRVRINNAIKSKGLRKKYSAVDGLGCTASEFKLYIESKFEMWMNWDNHGPYNTNKDTWHLDHIISLSKFDLSNPEEYFKACHYTNIQPLKARDNLIKNRF